MEGKCRSHLDRVVVRSAHRRLMPSETIFRAASPADAFALAELSIMAGDGMYEFLLEEMAPKEMLAGLMARSMKQDTGGFGWRHCFVADDQGVVGMINAYPAAWLLKQERDNLPQERVQILDPIDQAQDWESFLVNGVAVRPAHRRRGDREAADGVGRRAGESRPFCPAQHECVGRQRSRSCSLRKGGLSGAKAGRTTRTPRAESHRRQPADGAGSELTRETGSTFVGRKVPVTRHGRGIAGFFVADKLCV